MSPRKYEMGKRAAAKEETRRRIIEATAKLHGDKGVFGTSWQDIASESDVSVATVYAHFPTLDELLPACGALVMERAKPPRAKDAASIIGDEADPVERLRLAARALYSFYERGGRHLEVDARERELPGVREWEESQRTLVSAFVREAAKPLRPDAPTVRLVSAFFDLPTFQALRIRGIAAPRAADTVAELAARLIESRGATAQSVDPKEDP